MNKESFFLINIIVSPSIYASCPQFKLGVIQYQQIMIGNSPQMLRGRFQLYQENIKFDFLDQSVTADPAIQEWRAIVKAFGVDPARYRHSAEALLRRVKNGQHIQSVNSAVDVTNLLSLQYRIPFGIYDLARLSEPIELKIGNPDDNYEALNGRTYNLNNKLMLNDQAGPFGSPFVDSTRSSVTEHTRQALHIVYIQPSLAKTEAKRLLNAVADMFVSLHGGDRRIQLIAD